MSEKNRFISRSFRPQRFEEVVGQSAVVGALKNALLMDRVAHAYLFSGTRGTGKTTLARLFAKAINCLNREKGSPEPCGSCSSCLSIAAGSAFEVLEIDGASNRGIDDIRQINDAALFAPPQGMSKIILIDEVHMLTKEAFNALLKTLEEPPAHARFLFATTEPGRIPLTILSRCQRFNLSRLTRPEIFGKLAHVAKSWDLSISDEALQLLARRAEGSMRDAESMFERVLCSRSEGSIDLSSVETALGLLPLDWLSKLDRAMIAKDRAAVLALGSTLIDIPQEPLYIVELLIEHFRSHFFLPDSPFSSDRLSAIFALLSNTLTIGSKMHLRHLHLDMLFLQLVETGSRLSLEEIGKALLAGYQQEAPASTSLSASAPLPTPAPAVAATAVKSQPATTSDTNLMHFAAAALGGHLQTDTNPIFEKRSV